MAVLSITVPDANIAAVTASFASRFGYPGNALENETESEFTERMIADFVKNTWIDQSADAAAEVARADVHSSLDAVVIG